MQRKNQGEKMSQKRITLRSQQLALLSRIEHKMSTDPEIGRVLEKITVYLEYDILDENFKRETYI